MTDEQQSTPFYKKKFYGAKAQRMWQIGMGVGVFFTFVLAPAWFDYWMEYQKEKNNYINTKSTHRTDLQQRVYDKRIEFRKILQEESTGKEATP